MRILSAWFREVNLQYHKQELSNTIDFEGDTSSTKRFLTGIRINKEYRKGLLIPPLVNKGFFLLVDGYFKHIFSYFAIFVMAI